MEAHLYSIDSYDAYNEAVATLNLLGIPFDLDASSECEIGDYERGVITNRPLGPFYIRVMKSVDSLITFDKRLTAVTESTRLTPMTYPIIDNTITDITCATETLADMLTSVLPWGKAIQLICTGSSGVVMAMALRTALEKHDVIRDRGVSVKITQVAKSKDEAGHRSAISGGVDKNAFLVFVDDFICSGRSYRRTVDKIREKYPDLQFTINAIAVTGSVSVLDLFGSYTPELILCERLSSFPTVERPAPTPEETEAAVERANGMMGPNLTRDAMEQIIIRRDAIPNPLLYPMF